MALTLALAQGNPAGAPIVVNQPMQFTVTVTNTGAAAVSLTGLSIAESTESDATIGQPTWQTPNVSPGVTGNPVIAAGASVTYSFPVVFTSPNMPGVSPNNPGGAAPGPRAMEADANFTLQAQAQSSDGSVASAYLTVPVLSAVAPFPVPQGGAAQFAQGANSNLIAVFA
jgi:hypothetical protein